MKYQNHFMYQIVPNYNQSKLVDIVSVITQEILN